MVPMVAALEGFHRSLASSPGLATPPLHIEGLGTRLTGTTHANLKLYMYNSNYTETASTIADVHG